MIIGNGLLARSIAGVDRDDHLFIAAGVSDSKCMDPAPYQRELEMVRTALRSAEGRRVVYFSTFSINDPALSDNLYVKSKKNIEQLIGDTAGSSLIVRVSNLVGHGGNPNNLINFFIDAIETGKHFSVWSGAERNLIGAEHFALMVARALEDHRDTVHGLINIINARHYPVLEIVQAIEAFIGRKALYELVDRESHQNLHDEYCIRLFRELEIQPGAYLEYLLSRYYSGHRGKNPNFE